MSLSLSLSINTHAYVSHVNATHTHSHSHSPLFSHSLTLSPSNWNNSIYGHSSRPPWLRPLCMEPPPLRTKERENLPAGSPNDTHTKPISCQENTSRSAIFGQNQHPCGFFFFYLRIWVDATFTFVGGYFTALIWHVQLPLLLTSAQVFTHLKVKVWMASDLLGPQPFPVWFRDRFDPLFKYSVLVEAIMS